MISGRMADRLFGGLARSAAILTLVLLLAIMVSLIIGAWPAISEYGLGFLTSSVWDPVQDQYGGLVMIYGTLATSAIALIIAVPVSFGIALFLTELSPAWLKRPLGTAIELLAAVPSIVYGMWGLMVFGPVLATYVQQPLQNLLTGVPYLGAFVSGPPVGIGILSAGIILAIMIIPFIASVMRDVFEVTPALLKESAYGLGSTTWEVVWKVVLPYTKTGVLGGVMLGLGRALGETMAVTFVIGNMNQLNSLSVFEAANSITSALANEFAEAGEGLHQASLIYLGLVLFFITFVVLACPSCCSTVCRRTKEPAHEPDLHLPKMLDAADLAAVRQAKYNKRKRLNQVALTLSMAAMLFGVFWLVWILWETIRQGLGGLNFALFSQMTPPPNEEGGIANAIWGSLMMVALATFVGTPIGVMAGVYLAEYDKKGWLASTTRFVNDILLSAPPSSSVCLSIPWWWCASRASPAWPA
jgi:phosphate transport system permease protein